MSKSVLVMETPESCFGCNFCYCEIESEKEYCEARTIRKIINFKESIPDWCPLRPLPEKMAIPRGVRNVDGLEYAAGYNSCINEIAGGKIDD